MILLIALIFRIRESSWVLGLVAVWMVTRCFSIPFLEMRTFVFIPLCPISLLIVKPRKSNLFLRWVILFFSTDRDRRSVVERKCGTSSFTSPACVLVPLQRITKSSAYLA